MNKLIFTEHCIDVQCDRNDTETIALCNSLGIIWHHNRIGTSHKTSLSHTPEVLAAFRGINPDNIDKLPATIRMQYDKEMARRAALQDFITQGPVGNPYVTPTLTLDPHQQMGREISKIFDRFGFFYDTRTGKTPMSIAIMHDDISAHPDHKWLVICPLILIKLAWLTDLETFKPNAHWVNCHAETKDKRLKAISSKSNVYITNTESFAKYAQYFNPKEFAGVIVDESSDMKDAQSDQTKALVDFSKEVPRFYLLTGTPSPNGHWEYYSQLRALDYYCMHSSYTQFEQYFMVDLSYNSAFKKLTVRPDKYDELMSIIKHRAMYVELDDVYKTAGQDWVPVDVFMPDELITHYESMREELYIEIGETGIEAPNIGVKLNKLNQITSGFVLDSAARQRNKDFGTDEKDWYLLDMYRFHALVDLLARHPGDQIIIWATFRKEFEIIKELLGDKCATVYGGTSYNAKIDAVQRFKAGKVQYLVANPASADKGLTLTNCHINVYFSLSPSYETFRQSYMRIYGSIRNQPHGCTYYVMMAKGTYDSILYNTTLQGKAKNSSEILSHLKLGGMYGPKDC